MIPSAEVIQRDVALIDVCVVDDHALLSESVVMALRGAGISAVSVAHDNPKLVNAILEKQPGLVLLDLFLGQESDTSLAALGALNQARTKVLIVTATVDRLLHARCLELGAVGIVVKSEPIETLLTSVKRALRDETVMSKSTSTELLSELLTYRNRHVEMSLIDTLTGRERDVLQALTNGHPAGWIARQHGTSIVTVRTHIRAVLHKLDVHSQLEAVSMAARFHWFE
jgi:two-component system, NarL family, nitrate/nitrite response regulator NarL